MSLGLWDVAGGHQPPERRSVEIETSEGAGDCAKTAATELTNAMDNGSLIKFLGYRELLECNRMADLTLARCEGYGGVSDSAEKRAVPFRDVVFVFGHRFGESYPQLGSGWDVRKSYRR